MIFNFFEIKIMLKLVVELLVSFQRSMLPALGVVFKGF